MNEKKNGLGLSGNKKEIDDEFRMAAVEVVKEKEIFFNLLKQLIVRKNNLQYLEAELEKFEKMDKKPDRYDYVKAIIPELKEKVEELEGMKKKTAKDIEGVIGDPRWSELWFDEESFSPSKIDN